MKKVFVMLSVILLVLPTIFALDLNITKKSSEEISIVGFSEPVIFDLEIKNLGEKDTIEFYNLLGFEMQPSTPITIEKGETKEIQLKVSPRSDFDYRGFYAFQYYIKGGDDSQIQERLSFEIIDLKD